MKSLFEWQVLPLKKDDGGGGGLKLLAVKINQVGFDCMAIHIQSQHTNR
jgi:hypothetical protein